MPPRRTYVTAPKAIPWMDRVARMQDKERASAPAPKPPAPVRATKPAPKMRAQVKPSGSGPSRPSRAVKGVLERVK